MPHRVMTLAEVAQYLRVSRDCVEDWMRKAHLPHHRVGGRVEVRRAELDAWASKRILGFTGEVLREHHAQEIAAIPQQESSRDPLIGPLLKAGAIMPQLDKRTKSSLLRALVARAQATGHVYDPQTLLASIESREQLCSTALPGGVAVPHPLHHEPYLLETSFIVFARLGHPIPFGSPDGQTTDLFFLLCSEDDQRHLHLLSRLCMICHRTNLLDILRNTEDEYEMSEAIEQAEAEVLA